MDTSMPRNSPPATKQESSKDIPPKPNPLYPTRAVRWLDPAMAGAALRDQLDETGCADGCVVKLDASHERHDGGSYLRQASFDNAINRFVCSATGSVLPNVMAWAYDEEDALVHSTGGRNEPTCELEECQHRLCKCGHSECDHADENVQPNCSECQCNGFRVVSSSTPASTETAIKFTEVVGADGKGVAAPCAIDGCALFQGRATQAPSSIAAKEGDADEEGQLVTALEANEAAVKEYVNGYEWDAGDDGYHVPNEGERVLIEDAIAGLIADDDFVRTFNAWQDKVRAFQSSATAMPSEPTPAMLEAMCAAHKPQEMSPGRAAILYRAAVRAFTSTGSDKA